MPHRWRARLLERRRRVRRAELHRLGPLELHRIDRPDLLGTGEPGALHGVDPDATDPDHGDDVARPDLGGVHAGAPAGDDPAPEQAGPVEGHVVVDLDAARLVDDCVVGEGTENAHDPEVLALFA